VADEDPVAARAATLRARRRLLDWHQHFTRFEPDSELSRLNADPREAVPVSADMALFVDAALRAAAATGGLVDPTLVGELERAGYAGQLDGAPLGIREALARAPERRPAAPSAAARWREVSVDRDALTGLRQLLQNTSPPTRTRSVQAASAASETVPSQCLPSGSP
jgi:hypothetical protein